jgi:UDP-N-acetylglucosamine 2-epimerase (non-hydrolysing)
VRHPARLRSVVKIGVPARRCDKASSRRADNTKDAVRNALLVSGTRPEIVKLAPLYHALRGAADFNVQWLHTGQHDEMAQQILSCFDIVPDISLTRRGTSLGDFSVGCREQLEPVMRQQTWSVVMVQGDTESAFQGALAGFYNQVPVAHVEAGLRTYNLEHPFPEEALRQMITRIARFHFAPTARARNALLAEGVADRLIHLTGNTVVDAQLWTRQYKGIRRQTSGRGHLLVTVHRRENWGEPLEQICGAVADIADAHPDAVVVFPVHPNPIVRERVHARLGTRANINLVAPLDYLEMQQALADAWLVLTDSGGLQEEAPTFNVPLLVLRDETERPEAVEAGCAKLVGTSRTEIVAQAEQLFRDEDAYRQMQQHVNPFGDGAASQRIVTILKRRLSTTTGTSIAAA